MGALFLAGQPVRIRAKDDFFAFVDGWAGTVAGWNSGLVHVECVRDDNPARLHFFVPADQLEALAQ